MDDMEVLRFESVNYVRASNKILSNIDLSIHTGEHWALIGPNGAGKSTILNLCGALIHQSNGTIHVLGHRLGRVDIRELRESIGHVDPKHAPISPLSVLEVVLTGATGTRELMLRWIPDAKLLERADYLIEVLGLMSHKYSIWPTLSQGEKARTLIARSLLTNPKLLLFDEPSTGLDVSARESFLSSVDSMHKLQPDLTTVMVTHHFEELPETTTHAMLIKDGSILYSGVAKKILTSDNVSECFNYPIEIDYRLRRWNARAKTPDSTW
ncbi:MAG: ATP-binding cassette domain-containing protein [Acidimicrobiia bacterium]|nr:ATP-binding cassette domain-containing protein [Acidimicrobiia bacterium]